VFIFPDYFVNITDGIKLKLSAMCEALDFNFTNVDKNDKVLMYGNSVAIRYLPGRSKNIEDG